MGGILCERNPVWEESMWEESCVGRIPCGRNSVWEEFCVRGILCERNPVWEESCVGGIPWEESCREESHGRNPVGRNSMTTYINIYHRYSVSYTNIYSFTLKQSFVLSE